MLAVQTHTANTFKQLPPSPGPKERFAVAVADCAAVHLLEDSIAVLRVAETPYTG